MASALDSNSTILEIENNPFQLSLKRHQLALLFRVLNVEQNLRGSSCPFGIMSDKAGTGKTFVVLAMIYYCMCMLDRESSISLIIVPINIYSQWISAFERFYKPNTVKYKCFCNYEEATRIYTDRTLITNNNIILSTPLIYDSLAKTLVSMNIRINRIFFDEADTTQSILQYCIPTITTWFISASIENVFDKKTQKAKIGGYDISLPMLLKNNCYCSHAFIDANIKLPPIVTVPMRCRNFYMDTIIQRMFEKEDMKMLYAHDFSDKGIKNVTNARTTKSHRELVKNIYECLQKTIAQSNLQIAEFKKEVKYSKNRNDRQEKEAQLRDAENKQLKYSGRFTQINDFCDNNLICIQCFSQCYTPEFRTELSFYRTHCKNIVCNSCFNQKMDSMRHDEKTAFLCINCGKEHCLMEYIPDVINVGLEHNKEIEFNNMDKIVVLSKILDICGKKVILVSQHTGSNSVYNFLQKNNNFKFVELNKGNINGLDEILDNFKNKPDVKVLLIDNGSYGVGLNIEYATDMIFFHEVEPLMRHQLIGRAQRFGRTKKLYVWNMFYDGENNDK